MIPEDPERRVRACWSGLLTAEELVVLLEDDRAFVSAGNPSFDGDATTSYLHVSVAAVEALAKLAPTMAPMDRVADAMIRMSGKIVEVETSTYASPYEKPLIWDSRTIAPFGAPLVAALEARLDAASPEEAGPIRRLLDAAIS